MVEEAETVPEEAAVQIVAEPVAAKVVKEARLVKVVRVVVGLAIQTHPHKKPADCTGNLARVLGHVQTDTGAHGGTTRAPDRAMTET